MGVVACLYFLQSHPVNWNYLSGLTLEGKSYEDRRSFMNKYIIFKEAYEIIVFVSLF